MNSSERAAELALKYFPQYGNGAIRDSLSTDIESLAADSANLARGVAIEQAAKICGSHTYANLILSLDPDAAQALAAQDEELRQKFAHECELFHSDAKRPCITCSRLDADMKLAEHDAEIERRARLDEAGRRNQHDEWCEDNRHEQCLCGKRRIAALAESQPAPAKRNPFCVTLPGQVPAPAKEGEK